MNLRQFFTLLRQQRLFSGIYILCTALSTALTMTLFLVVYIMVGPVYPELERSRMAVVKAVSYRDIRNDSDWSSRVSLALADTLRNMPEVEVLTAIGLTNVRQTSTAGGDKIKCISRDVDDTYWQVFNFSFIHGRAFNHDEFEAQSPVCVVTEGLARKLYGRTDVVGMPYNAAPESTNPMRIIGVVEDVSRATPQSYAEVWMPRQDYNENVGNGLTYQGYHQLVMLLRKGKTIGQLQERMSAWQERINQELEAAQSNYRLKPNGQPVSHWQGSFFQWEDNYLQQSMRKIAGLLLAFLLIPAMNMSSMVGSRINARISEMGIRRAYGAGRATLLWQVLQENFLLTLCGSLLGLALSWLIITLGADWLPFIFNPEAKGFAMTTPIHIHIDMLFSGWVMLAVLVATLALNLISALVPTLWTLHKSVTESINHKR